jgi:hypothetical protein
MDNGDLANILIARMDRLELKIDASATQQVQAYDKIDDKIDKTVIAQTLMCQAHDDRIAVNEQQLAILNDRQEQSAKASNKRIAVIGSVVAVGNVLIAYLLQKIKL